MSNSLQSRSYSTVRNVRATSPLPRYTDGQDYPVTLSQHEVDKLARQARLVAAYEHKMARLARKDADMAMWQH